MASLRQICNGGAMTVVRGPHGVRVSWLLSPGSPGYDERDPQTAHGKSEAAPAPAVGGLLASH
jgi:hypothetical protein